MTRVPVRQLVDHLSQSIDKTLGGLLFKGDRCALIDYPGHSNVGDSAIWLGERAWLDRVGIVVSYTCDASTYSEERLRARVGRGPILIHGGGNLGDLWPRHQELRETVVRAFPRNKIIQLPQTLWFNEQESLARARAAFDSHPDFTLLVRDPRSLELARSNFRATSLLCPDMAFALGPLARAAAPSQDLVSLLRQDIESVGHGAATEGLGRLSVDWLGDQPSARLWLERFLVKQRCRHPRASNWCAPVLVPLQSGLWDGLARERVQRGCAMLSRGKVVITDRLHGHILCLLLNIPHVVLDNSYRKVSSFYEAWTQASDLAHFATTPDEAIEMASNLITRNA